MSDIRGLALLLPVIQHNNGKVLPVMNFKELDSFIDNYTTEAVVCSRKFTSFTVGREVVEDACSASVRITNYKLIWLSWTR